MEILYKPHPHTCHIKVTSLRYSRHTMEPCLPVQNSQNLSSSMVHVKSALVSVFLQPRKSIIVYTRMFVSILAPSLLKHTRVDTLTRIRSGAYGPVVPCNGMGKTTKHHSNSPEHFLNCYSFLGRMSVLTM